MDSRPPNSTLLVAFVKFDKFDHDFYTFFALILHDLALTVLSLMNNYRGSSNSYYSRTSEIPIEKKNPSIIFFESES